MKLNLSQQMELFDPGLARPVTVIGAGSVGSQVVSMLARLGATDITIWDADSVESHNVPMSAYGPEHLGRYKVEALRDLVLAQTGIEINIRRQMYNGEPLRSSVVCCVDTMAARGLIFEQVNNNPLVDLLVDTRTSEEYLEVYSVRPCDADETRQYAKLLYPDSTALRFMCGKHGVIYVTSLTAAVAVSRLTTAWKGGKNKWRFRFQVGSLTSV